MNPITTVLFDFDGTIMNTNDVIIQSWQHLFRTVEGKERPLEEIAKVLGCGLAGAKSRVHRARHKLRELVMAEFGEDILISVAEEGGA